MREGVMCPFCGHHGELEHAHGKAQCGRCKQISPEEECCQGKQITGEKQCSDGETQSKELQI
jgi:hypothetical protein